MAMKLILSPWRGGTPRRLAASLNAVVRTPEKFDKPRLVTPSLILNWGCGKVLPVRCRVLNHASRVAVAANKLRTFQALSEAKIATLEWTKDVAEALKWHKTSSVIGHHNLHGHSGSGLTLFKKGEGGPSSCKVYTKYFPKRVECRVLCVRSGDTYSTFYMEKKRVLENRYKEFDISEAPTTFVRTYSNGWIYSREVPDDPKAMELAIRAMKAMKLDYGAVDVMKDTKGNYVVGEVNTAPGLEGQALSWFSLCLGRLINPGSH